MRLERLKYFAAVLSLASVVSTIGVSASSIKSLAESPLILGISAAAAAVAALITLFASHRQREKRAPRRVFLIYAREDREQAESLYDALKERGFLPWLDTKDLLPGQVWSERVKDALEESAVALVLVSQRLANKKGFVQKEVKIALDMLESPRRTVSPVIPVRLEDVPVPLSLRHIQWVDLFKEDGFNQLTKSLKEWAPERPKQIA